VSPFAGGAKLAAPLTLIYPGLRAPAERNTHSKLGTPEGLGEIAVHAGGGAGFMDSRHKMGGNRGDIGLAITT